jgi:DNA-binding HxlR family transcriptional regulator
MDGGVDRIGDRWTILIIGAMADGEPVRFTDLLHTIEGISQKMLTKNLRAPERDGVVIRTVHPSAPVRIEYRLSDLGMSLLEPLAALRQWAIDHLDDVVLARTAHDVSDGDAAGPSSDQAPAR